MRILIVDDEIPIQRGIAAFLRNRLDASHEIATAGNGGDVLRRLDSGWQPDVMLTDVLMPGMDGLELARQMRARLPMLRIVMVSGSSEFAHVKESMRCMADDYLLKPVQPSELLDVVAMTLERCERGRLERDRAMRQRRQLDELMGGKHPVTLLSPLSDPHGSRTQRLVKHMLHVARSRYEQPLSVKVLAAELSISPNYLSTLFKQEQGVSFTDYLTDIRLQRAVDLLSDSAMKVSDIARRVGYEDQNYFARVFRKQFGYTPTEYREHI